jgi:hypothetical protein
MFAPEIQETRKEMEERLLTELPPKFRSLVLEYEELVMARWRLSRSRRTGERPACWPCAGSWACRRK